MPKDVRFAENQEPRCPVVLLLDTSGSMDGQPIQELNRGLVTLKQELQKDTLASQRVEIAIITFGPVQMRKDFSTVDDWTVEQYVADNVTPTGEAINYALDILEDCKQDYKNNGIQYYRPWLFLITDGVPTDDWQYAAQRLKQASHDKKVAFFAVGVQGADMNILSQMATPDFAAVALNGLNFSSMFKWLSNSLGSVSQSKPGSGQQVVLTQPVWGTIVS